MKRALLATALLISAWSVTAGDDAGAGAVIDRGVDTAGTPLASHIDYTRPGSRALPVRCKDGDVEYFAGKTMGDVFGAAWPEAPAATHTERARMVQAGPMVWPHGLGQNGAAVVVAVLVGPNGRAIDARAVCASAPVIAGPAVKSALRSRYAPATFDGTPQTSVAVRVSRFSIRDNGLRRPDSR